MITVIKQPDNAVLARNDVNYIFETDNLVITPGAKANCLLIVISLIGNTGTFTINFLGLSVVFTGVSGTPNPNAYEFKDGGFANYTDYANHLILMLKKHYKLSDNYNITIDVVGAFAASIKIEAKKVGPGFNINGTSTIATLVFSGTVITGVDTLNRDRFKILHDVYLENNYASNVFNLLFTGAAIPNNQLQAEFNITDVLRSALSYHIPNFTDNTRFLNQSVKRFYTVAAESFGFPTQVSVATLTATKLAFLGGQNFVTAAQETFQADYINAFPQKFFTAMPNNTMVSKEQKQYLSFYVYDTVTIKLFVQLFYTDNSREIKEVNIYDPITIPGIYTFAVGYNQLSLDDYKVSTKTVKAYTLIFCDASADEIYTQSQTFEVDQMPQLFARHILFFNSFGLPETIYFTGKQTKNLQFKSDLVRKADLQFDTENGIFEGEFTESNNELQFGYELNSGWRSADWINYFTDFILSRKRLLQAADKWIGLNIPAQKISLLEDDKPLVAVKFTYQDSFIEKGVAE